MTVGNFAAYAEIIFKLVKLGADMTPIIANAIHVAKSSTGPTQADWDALHTFRDAYMARLKALE